MSEAAVSRQVQQSHVSLYSKGFILISLEAGRGRGLQVFVLFREVLEVA